MCIKCYKKRLLMRLLINRGGSRSAAISKMEPQKPLTIITKRPIFDVAAVLDPPLMKEVGGCYGRVNFEDKSFDTVVRVDWSTLK